jgi:flavin reductase (DIM6/NTAB) family NADH-FMN oxidoreductase RutF
VLGESHAIAARALAAKSGDRFAGLQTKPSADSALFIGGASVWIEAVIDESIAAGDHTIVILRITDVTIHADTAPIVFHRSGFHRLDG